MRQEARVDVQPGQGNGIPPKPVPPPNIDLRTGLELPRGRNGRLEGILRERIENLEGAGEAVDPDSDGPTQSSAAPLSNGNRSVPPPGPANIKLRTGMEIPSRLSTSRL